MRINLNLLIIDDQIAFSDTLKDSLSTFGYNILQAFTGETALDIIHDNEIDICFLDVYLPDINGFNLIADIRKLSPECEIIIMTAYQENNYITKSIKEGVYFLPKPFKIEDLDNILKKVEKKRNFRKSKSENKENIELPPYLRSSSKEFNKIVDFTQKISLSDYPILIMGEKGSDCSLFAEYIHHNSKRKNEIFLMIDFSSLPEEFIEIELLGNKKKKGLFELTTNGTLFIKNIEIVDNHIQETILKIIETRHFIPIDNTEEKTFNTRIIFFANNEKKLNKKLLQKMNSMKIVIPPLRKRKKDIIQLIHSILEKWNIEYKKFIISKSAENLLLKYNWPGNYYELKNTVEKSIILSNGKGISVDTLSNEILNFEQGIIEKRYSLHDMEKQHILNTIIKLNGNKAKAARLLGIDRKTLYRKIEKYKIDKYLE